MAGTHGGKRAKAGRPVLPPSQKQDEQWMETMRKMGVNFGNTPMTLEEIGTVMGCTRERIRQIEVKALRKLRIALRHIDIHKYGDISTDTHEVIERFGTHIREK